MKITLEAKSSSGDYSYNVGFWQKNGLLSVWCDCPAGEWGKFCKHKWQLLNGNEKMLADASQADELNIIKELAIERGIDKLYKKVDDLENQKKELAKIQKKEKDRLKKVFSKKVVLSELEFMEERDTFFHTEKSLAYITYLISKEKEIVEKNLKEGF